MQNARRAIGPGTFLTLLVLFAIFAYWLGLLHAGGFFDLHRLHFSGSLRMALHEPPPGAPHVSRKPVAIAPASRKQVDAVRRSLPRGVRIEQAFSVPAGQRDDAYYVAARVAMAGQTSQVGTWIVVGEAHDPVGIWSCNDVAEAVSGMPRQFVHDDRERLVTSFVAGR